MDYQTPEHRRDDVRRALRSLRAARRVILTTHMNADGDGCGAQVAMAAWLRALGTEAWIVNPTPFPSMFDFLVPESSWVASSASDRGRELCAQADLAVVLDTGEIPRLGRVKPMIEGLRTVVVDHHPPGDRPIPGVSFRDPQASATGELVYDLMVASDGPWPREALVGIYVAILTDTGSFRFSNSTPGSHRVTAELVERGVDPEEMYLQVYGGFPLRRFRLLQACLETLETDDGGGVSWMQVPRAAYDDLGASPDDLEGLVDYPRTVVGTEVALLFRQTERGDTKVSLRSNGPVDVNALARQFGGGGHVKASGALLDEPPDDAIPRVVTAARRLVQATLSGGASGEPAGEEGRT